MGTRDVDRAARAARKLKPELRALQRAWARYERAAARAGAALDGLELEHVPAVSLAAVGPLLDNAVDAIAATLPALAKLRRARRARRRTAKRRKTAPVKRSSSKRSGSTRSKASSRATVAKTPKVQAEFLAALERVAKRESPGALLSVREVRRELPRWSKRQFDSVALDLQRRAAVVMHFHDAPGHLPKADRDELVTDGRTFYVGIAARRKVPPLNG